MRKRRVITIGNALLVAAALSWGEGEAVAAEKTPLTPEMAAKREMVRKQQEQRVTPEEREAAAEALKAERQKAYDAWQRTQKSTPATDGKKPSGK